MSGTTETLLGRTPWFVGILIALGLLILDSALTPPLTVASIGSLVTGSFLVGLSVFLAVRADRRLAKVVPPQLTRLTPVLFAFVAVASLSIPLRNGITVETIPSLLLGLASFAASGLLLRNLVKTVVGGPNAPSGRTIP